jgi:hypothetical protein
LDQSKRLSLWKSFRKDIGNMPIELALEKTAELWNQCPFSPFYLPEESAENWPDPWQLLKENYYCDLAKALGIVYTIHLSGHNTLDPEIHIYFDNVKRHTYHIAYFANGKYILNLIEHAVVNKEHINQSLKLTYRYTACDMKLDQY